MKENLFEIIDSVSEIKLTAMNLNSLTSVFSDYFTEDEDIEKIIREIRTNPGIYRSLSFLISDLTWKILQISKEIEESFDDMNDLSP